MKKLLLAAVAAVTLAFSAAPASAKVAAVYATGQGGLQNNGATDPGLGFELGGRVLIFDGYIDYTGFGQGQSVSRGILGLRGGFGGGGYRLVLRGGAGTIHEDGGALTGPLGAPARTGGVARIGAAFEGAVNPLLYLGFGVDGETYKFADNALGIPSEGSDIFATLRLTFELGI
jgi:opacity protein-like surface antigen